MVEYGGVEDFHPFVDFLKSHIHWESQCWVSGQEVRGCSMGSGREEESCPTQPGDVFDDHFLGLLDNEVLFDLHQCFRT